MAGRPPIAIIAGNGQLPMEIAQAISARGERVLILGIDGEVDPTQSDFDTQLFRWGQIGQMSATLQEFGVEKIILAGGVTQRPNLKSVGKPDWETVKLLPEMLASALVGDDAALSKVISVIQKRGMQVVSLREILPELLVKPESNGSKKPSAKDMSRMELGAEVARSLGPYDIGQSVVVIGKRVVAIEGAEGTDAMIERVARLRVEGRVLPRGGVLVKCFKPGQDVRADLPTIGPITIANAHAAGLDGLGVDAGYSIIVERERTLRRANDLGMFVYGLSGGNT